MRPHSNVGVGEFRLPVSAPPPSALRAALLPALLLFGAMLNLTLVVPGLKELVVDELGGTPADAALFVTVEMVAYLIFAPVWGLLSDRTGRRRPLIVAGFVVSGALYFTYLLLDTVPVLLSLRFLQGAASIAGWSTALALAFDHADETSRPRVAGLAGASMILGVGLGAPIGGVMTTAFGAHAPLVLAGVLFFALGAVALALAEPAGTVARPGLGEIARTLAARPRLLLPWGFYFIERFTVGMFVVLFPLYLADLTGAGADARGRALACYLLPFAFLQLGTYRLTRRFGALPVLGSGMVLYGLAMAGLSRVGPGALIPFLVVLGGLAAVIFPPTLALTAQWGGETTRASALAGFNLVGSLGFALGPVTGAWAFARAGYGFAFDLAGGLAVTAALLLAVAARALRRVSERG